MNCKYLPGAVIFNALFIMIMFFPSMACPRVTGICSNCHIMHNSQNGNEIDSEGPNESLTIDSCVGCHSSASSETVLSLGSGDLPIVFNNSQPARPLAGGNFYWIASRSDHTLGHNVKGIAGADINLDYVPGKKMWGDNTLSISQCYSCHSVGFPQGYPGIPFTLPRTGNVLLCRDCHTVVAHHADDSATVVDGTGGWYRFLYEVKGIEDDDWEQSVSELDHNEYQGEVSEFNGSISDAGCACHGDFHALKNPGGVGQGSPWIRHPVDVALPDKGEYASYTVYDPTAPVARPDLSGYGGPSPKVNPGTDQVMCISCHRPHASDQPDMLRWDYDTMITGGGQNNKGCFICHTTKDEAQ